MIHLHVRDADGQGLLDASAYRAAIAKIREAVGDRPVIRITSESLGHYTPAEQQAVILQTHPEAISLALRELAPGEADEKALAAFLSQLKEMRVWPQFLLYSPDDAARLGGK